MPFLPVVTNLIQGQSDHGWQMRIAIDPLAILKTNPNNKLEIIKAILRDKLKAFPVDAKIWELDNELELLDCNDGTTSNKGIDRDQRGKEVCIYFKDSSQQQPTVAEYKQFILSLWQALEAAGVPLLYIANPGDRKILGPAGLYTPFSFTSEEARGEWNDKHGLVFKQFVGYDQNHPILQVKFTEQDLQEGGINFLPAGIVDNNRTTITHHQQMARKKLSEDIEFFIRQANYRDTLFNNNITNKIRAKLQEYQEQLALLEGEQRAKFQVEFTQQMQNFPEYQFLKNHYPHEPSSRFTETDNITGLCQWKNISLKQFDEIIAGLRMEYDQRVADIKNDYKVAGDISASFSAEQIKSQPISTLQQHMKINWSEYFPNHDVEKLIEHNPERMQVMYRRIFFLEREKQAYEQFQQNCADPKVVTVKLNLERALIGITTYCARPREVFSLQTHLGFFSRVFDNGRGLKRAQVYQDILNSDNYSLPQKALTLYALLATGNGKILKEDVAESILGRGNRNVAVARAKVAQLVHDVCNSVSLERLNEIGNDIVHYANQPTFGNASAIPDHVWRGINGQAQAVNPPRL